MNATLQNPLAELQQMISGTVAAFPDSRMCRKALKAVMWRMRGPNGEFVGLKNLRCAFVPEADAMIFDGRDNEAHKLQNYQAALGPLTIEIIPQVK